MDIKLIIVIKTIYYNKEKPIRYKAEPFFENNHLN